MGNLASAAIWAISGMDALRIKCNKAGREVGTKGGWEKNKMQRQQARLDSACKQMGFFFSGGKGGGVGPAVDAHKHKHWFPRRSARQERAMPVCYQGSLQTRPSLSEQISHFLPVCVCACLSEDQSEFEIVGVRPLCGYFRLVLPVRHTFKVLSEVIGFRTELHLG